MSSQLIIKQHLTIYFQNSQKCEQQLFTQGNVHKYAIFSTRFLYVNLFLFFTLKINTFLDFPLLATIKSTSSI
jgi:hypothetical protein